MNIKINFRRHKSSSQGSEASIPCKGMAGMVGIDFVMTTKENAVLINNLKQRSRSQQLKWPRKLLSCAAWREIDSISKTLLLRELQAKNFKSLTRATSLT